ncbi:MAG TPA: putative 2OG-Fe(II) oxygenase [Sphingomicrobium sp.]
MTVKPLAADDSAAVSQAYAALQSGRGQDSIHFLLPLLRAGKRHPDILLVYALACELVGRKQEGMGACQAAINEDPQRAEAWAQLGRMLHESGQPGEAVVRLEKAVELNPSLSDAWYNLGLARNAAGSIGGSVEALNQAVQLAPEWAAAWSALGTFQQQAGDLEGAEQSLLRALELAPGSVSARHNLAATLRLQDRPNEAQAEIDRLRAAGALATETQTLEAHLLGDQGKLEEAAKAYANIVEASPGALDAHETLARLLPHLGRGAEALAAYDEALRKAPSGPLYSSALSAAWDLKDPARIQAWAAQAIRDVGDHPQYRAMSGMGLGLAGEHGAALQILEPLAQAGMAWLLPHCAYFRLAIGDLQQAESHALAATEIDPADQSSWAYLSIIWRLMEDERELKLADYERFVLPIDLDPPAGFASTGEFMAAVATELTKLHVAKDHPPEQSVRGGTQTRGNLFDKKSPLIRQLSGQIEQAIKQTISALPQDPLHPFLGRNTLKTRFAASWSVRIKSGGFHSNHIHQKGWLSSALYISLPGEVASASATGSNDGALAFGVPDPALGFDLEPRRIEYPKVGRLVLFPSYFWHGTMPFESDEPRLTVAFDAVPA